MTIPGQKIVNAGIYCRMSLAVMGDTTKVDDQERICREQAERLGWHVPGGGVYQDNNRSAWHRNRKRLQWDRMLADIASGRLSALIIYHGDRLIRQPFDLEILLQLAEGKGIRIAAPTGMRDLGNADDRFVLRIEAAMACRESDNISRRRKAQYDRWRRQGRVRPGGRGGRAFGFRTDNLTPVPAEAELVRQAADRILGGESASALARWLTAAGARSTTGAEFSAGALRKLLMRPRYAGLMPDGVHQAAWDPVLDQETWEAVCAVLRARGAGFPYASNARRWLLTGIARCCACGSGMQISHKSSTAVLKYACRKPGCRKVARQVAALDEYVIIRTCRRLGLQGNPRPQRLASRAAEGEFAILAQQRTEVEALVSDHAQPHLQALLARLSSLDKRLAELRELAAGDATARVRERHAGITPAQFRDLPLGEQRTLVSACWTITVKRASRKGPGFVTGDVDLAPR